MRISEIDWRDPIEAVAPLAREPYACLLHAGETAPAPGWSILAAFPSRRVESRAGATLIDGARASAPAFAALAGLHAERRRLAAPAPFAAPFFSGLIGFAGYEMGAALEPSAAGPASPFALPDMAFGAYDAAILFDRAGRRAFLAAREEGAGARLLEALGDGDRGGERAQFSALSSNFSPARYRAAAARVVELIRDGALFQANLSQQLRARTGARSPQLAVFAELAKGDAPFGAFLQYEDGTLLSDSPERFFSIEPRAGGARILAEPIKGTRPRGGDPQSDAALAAELLADPKERAENVMIADLTRNDLSRICRDGSIREEAVCALVHAASVHHLVSRISGRLNEGLTAIDALAALFPCGSVTGAPKIEAMKTIAAVEDVGRGPYCGAIGYVDDRGGADFAVAIRTLILTPSADGATATLPVGGAVTLRSDPHTEYIETLVKARRILGALGIESAPS